jgi:hypothetical protein
MTEVYKALDEPKCEWKTLASYRVRCRWVPTGAGGGGAGRAGGGGDVCRVVLGQGRFYL